MIFFAFAGALAVLDWISVATGRRRFEYVLKPAVIVALIGAAVTLDPADDLQRALFVAALVLSLAGDVFLMLPGDFFLAGLGAFLLGHLAYIAGFSVEGPAFGALAVAAIAVAAVGVPVGSRILRGTRSSSPKLGLAVAAYMIVISAMVVAAIATGDVRAGIGAVLFYASDALIAIDRFVAPVAWSRLAVMVTYHLAQGALVASLLS